MTVTLNTIKHSADGSMTVGTITIPDTGPVRQRPRPTTISAAEWYARLADAEKAAIAVAVLATPALFVGIVHGLVNGSIDLTSVELKAWLDGLVQAGVLTAQRETDLLTP